MPAEKTPEERYALPPVPVPSSFFSRRGPHLSKFRLTLSAKQHSGGEIHVHFADSRASERSPAEGVLSEPFTITPPPGCTPVGPGMRFFAEVKQAGQG